MADYGINFRSSSGFVTDGTNEIYWLATDRYPTTRGGITAGWDGTTFDGTVLDRNRNASADRRLAGCHLTATVARFFRLDMDAADTKNVHAALGEDTFGEPVEWDFQDNTTSFKTFTGSVSAGHFRDASDTDRTTAAWPGAEVSVSRTFASTQFRLKCNSSGGNNAVAHLRVVTAAASTLVSGATGSYTETAGTADKKIAWKAAGGTGTFTETAGTASIKLAWHMAGGSASYTLTGSAAGVQVSWKVQGAAASFTLTGGTTYGITAWRMDAPTAVYTILRFGGGGQQGSGTAGGTAVYHVTAGTAGSQTVIAGLLLIQHLNTVVTTSSTNVPLGLDFPGEGTIDDPSSDGGPELWGTAPLYIDPNTGDPVSGKKLKKRAPAVPGGRAKRRDKGSGFQPNPNQLTTAPPAAAPRGCFQGQIVITITNPAPDPFGWNGQQPSFVGVGCMPYAPPTVPAPASAEIIPKGSADNVLGTPAGMALVTYIRTWLAHYVGSHCFGTVISDLITDPLTVSSGGCTGLTGCSAAPATTAPASSAVGTTILPA